MIDVDDPHTAMFIAKLLERSLMPAVVEGIHATAHPLAPHAPDFDWGKVYARCIDLQKARPRT